MNKPETVTIYFRESVFHKVDAFITLHEITDVTKVENFGSGVQIDSATQPHITTIPWDVILYIEQKSD